MTLAFPKPTPRPKEKPKGLQRSRMEKKLPRRLDDPGQNDTAYRKFVVRLGYCCAASLPGASRCSGPIQPAHMTLSANEKGFGMKTHDRQCVPLCQRHHREADNERQPGTIFFEKTKPERYAAIDTNLAATPEDRDAALAFAELGLGRLVDDDGVRFRWDPGPAPRDEDMAAAAREVDALTPGSPPIAAEDT